MLTQPRPAGHLLRLVSWLLGVSLWFSPRPTAFLIRRVFQRTGADAAAKLDREAPTDVNVLHDLALGDDERWTLDLYRPASVEQGLRIPTVVWIHGGAFVGGAKHEIAGYMRRLAAAGFAVAAPRYPLAPESRFPAPLTAVTSAIRFLDDNAPRYDLDSERVVLAGDSAGALTAAQLAALATNPAYAESLGLEPPLEPGKLRGVVLCCGPYDLIRIRPSPAFEKLVKGVLWAYSGTRRYERNAYFTTAMHLTDHITSSFPPAFVTVGNADPLARHTDVLISALTGHGVAVDSLLFPPDHRPRLGHEYQFDPDLDAARTALERIVGFLRERTAAPAR